MFKCLKLTPHDFLWCGNDFFFRNVIKKIQNQFIIGKEFNTAFRYLALDLRSPRSYIVILNALYRFSEYS